MSEKIFDLKNITVEDIYIGNIYIITNIEKDYTRSQLTKKDAILIRINNTIYVDLEIIKSKSDLIIINEMLKRNDINNNILLSDIISNAFVGKLFIGDISLLKDSIEKKILKNTL